MKKRIIIVVVIIVLIVLAIIIGVFFNKKEDSLIRSIKEFRYSYTGSMVYNGDEVFELKCDDKCTAYVKLSGKDEKDKVIVEVDDKFVKDLIDIFNQYHIEKWDGFNQSDLNVSDGTSFSFSLTTKEGQMVSASGYMKWPDGFDEATKKINILFKSLEGVDNEN